MKSVKPPYRLPAVVPICDQDWEVIYVDKFSDALKHEVQCDGKLFGYTDIVAKRIFLEVQGATRETLVHVLVHELCHAVLAALHCEIPNNTEEKAVRALSAGWLSILRSSKPFWLRRK